MAGAESYFALVQESFAPAQHGLNPKEHVVLRFLD